MADELEFMIEEFAFQLAHRDRVQLAEVKRRIGRMFVSARQEYCDAGAPYGDTAACFLI